MRKWKERERDKGMDDLVVEKLLLSLKSNLDLQQPCITKPRIFERGNFTRRHAPRRDISSEFSFFLLLHSTERAEMAVR